MEGAFYANRPSLLAFTGAEQLFSLMHKHQPWAPLGAECDAISELQKKEMDENKLLIRFSIAFFI